MSKKILIFSLVYYPNLVGGAEAAVKEITDRIDKKDIEFHMVTNRFNSEFPKISKEGNVLVHRIGISTKNPSFEDLGKFPLQINKIYFQFAAAFKALKLHRKYKYDAIWALMAHSSGVPAVIFKMLRPKVPFVLTLQEGDPIEHIEKVMKPLWFFFVHIFKKADVVQAISKYLADWARVRGFRGPLEVIYNGGNPGDFKADFSKEELDKLKRDLDFKEGHKYLVTASRLVEKNALDDVIRALKFLDSNIHFIILGGGPLEKDLKKLTQDLGVFERVKFLGQIERSEVPKYRKIADIFVRPSRSEGLGNAMISAMAARLPVIATQEGGIKEFLFDAKLNPDKAPTGWVVDKNNPEQIAQAVKEILDNPEKSKIIIDNAYKLVSEKYRWENIAGDMREKVFGRVL